MIAAADGLPWERVLLAKIDVVEALFKKHGVPYIRTAGHNQGDIAKTFGVTVSPAPDFVVFDATNTLRAMLECKETNDGGTAQDKANRFRGLQGEGARLGGVPVLGVLGGTGRARVKDTLGPVLRYTDGRVFTLETLDDMMTVAPFPQLKGIIQQATPATQPRRCRLRLRCRGIRRSRGPLRRPRRRRRAGSR